MWFTQSIKRAAFQMGLKPYPFLKYFTLQQAAFMLHMTEGEFSFLILQQDRIKAFQLSNGDVYIHPDGVLSMIRAAGKKVTLRVALHEYRRHLRLENKSETTISEEEKSALG
jgi:hypothetical protein